MSDPWTLSHVRLPSYLRDMIPGKVVTSSFPSLQLLYRSGRPLTRKVDSGSVLDSYFGLSTQRTIFGFINQASSFFDIALLGR